MVDFVPSQTLQEFEIGEIGGGEGERERGREREGERERERERGREEHADVKK